MFEKLENLENVHWHLKVWSNCLTIPEIISFDKQFLLKELQFRKFVYGTITGYELTIDLPYSVLFSDYTSIRIFPCSGDQCEVVKGKLSEPKVETNL